MMAASNAYIFSTLEKFSDGNGTELNAFLSRFDRCCVVANKVDADNLPVKGQLLMLFVEGRARAALEEFELANGGVQQTYVALVAKLKEYFDSSSARESSMTLFESRTLKVNETEEEFMLQLQRLYSTANPDHAADVSLLAVKRKFLAGISPSLRDKVFVFCSDPYHANVTRENLLSHCRSARNLLSSTTETPSSSTDYSTTDRVLVSSSEGNLENQTVINTLNNLTIRFEEHVRNTDRRLDEFGDTIAAVSGNSSRFRSVRGGRGGSNRGRNNQFNTSYNNSNFSYNNSNNNNRGGSKGRGNFRGGSRGAGRKCYACSRFGHLARDCPFSEN